MKIPTRFQINGLFGNRDIDLPINGNALILVGPNGIGKSSVINIFYFTVSKQWSRLTEYQFKSVCIWFGEEKIEITFGDVVSASHYDKFMSGVSPRISGIIEKIKSENLLGEFFSYKNLSNKSQSKLSETLGMSKTDIASLQLSLGRRGSWSDAGDLFSGTKINPDKIFSDKKFGRVLYLPTYRRIEKDIKEIFPDLEERLRHGPGGPLKPGRAAKHYVDLVSFGMDDVRANIDSKLRYLKDYSLNQHNQLSGLYLKDVINGKADQYSSSDLDGLDNDILEAILNRVSEEILSPEEKLRLTNKIMSMKSKGNKRTSIKDKYLAHYFNKLVDVSYDISLKEAEISAFAELCNQYLRPSKIMYYNDVEFSIKILDDQKNTIDLSVLSSGEKQIISLFSHLYLDESKDQIVIIDEPELSLSVPWQKRFLSNILSSQHCSFIMAVTHSPFIYQGEMKNFAVDLRSHTNISR